MEDKTIRIILADSHETIRQTWKLLLQSDHRFSIVAECDNEAELMETVSKMNVDIILMDTDSHSTNSFDARKILKQYSSIKIIGISVHDQPTQVHHLFRSGVSGLVTKDSPKAEMIKAILTVHGGGKFICEIIAKKMKQQGYKEFFQ